MQKVFKKYLPLLIAISFFIGFGLYHLTKFETIDEHFWKYDRIEKYYHGWQEKKFKKTRINDKPGVTVALVSGMGLPFSPELKSHENKLLEKKYIAKFKNGKTKKLYTIYKTTLTEKINLTLRLPLLLFNGLIMLPLLFFILQRAFNNRIASLGIILLGTNPILIGISQIINPDALLWSFSAGALFSFIALLKSKEKKFIFLTGLLTGFALLSKYTANLLFLFYSLIYILYYLNTTRNKLPNKKQIFLTYCKNIISLIIIAWATLITFMPAVIIKPQHFLYATIYSPALKIFVDIPLTIFHLKDKLIFDNGSFNILPLGLFSLSIFIILFIILPPFIIILFHKYRKKIMLLGKFFIILLLLVFILSFINAWFKTPLFSLDNLKETSRVGGKMTFPQFKNDLSVIFWLKSTLVQAQNFIFSLNPLLVFALLGIFITSLKKQQNKYSWLIYFSAIVPFIFFLGASSANIFVNVRYSLMLYPIFTIIGSIGLLKFYDKINWQWKKGVFLSLILIFNFYSLWQIKPFYFNYTNLLLPQHYVVTDSWGYGLYEAAQKLNSLPDAKNIVIWSDRGGIAQFFVGKTINSREIYLDYTPLDYIVLTRRGVLTREPLPRTNNPAKKNITFKKYYSPKYFNHPFWQLNIDNRPGNFIKIIKIDDGQKVK